MFYAKYVYLFFIFFVFQTFSSANVQIDSLKLELENAEGKSKIEILNELTWLNRSQNPDQALTYGFTALHLAKKSDDFHLIAKSYNFLGLIYRNTGIYYKAKEFFELAIKMAQSDNDSAQIAYSLNNIGGINRLQGHYDLAIKNILNANKIFIKLNDEKGIAFCYINIAMCYRKLGNYSLSLEYLDKTLVIRKKLNDIFGQSLVLNQIAEVYFDQKMFEKVIFFYEKALLIYEELDDQKGIASVLGGIGAIYFSKNDFHSALEYRQQSVQINKEIKNPEGIINDYNNLGLIYLKLGDPQKGLNTLKESLELATKINSQVKLMETYESFYKFFELQNKYKDALKFQSMFYELKEKILSSEKTLKIAQIENQSKIEKTIQENESLKNDLKTEEKFSNYLGYGIVILSFLGIIFVFRYYEKNKMTVKLNKIISLKNKFFYILAHDLRGPFNSLDGFTTLLRDNYKELSEIDKIESIIEISKVTKNVYNLLENLLEWSRLQTETIEFNPKTIELKEVISTNCKLFEQSAKNKNIIIKFLESEELKIITDIYMLNTIIRNLINNAIKFSRKNGEIEISILKVEKFAKIVVKDFGVGISYENIQNLFKIDVNNSTLGTNQEKGTGLGLILCQELVSRMGGEINVESKLGTGSTFSFTVPLATS